MKETVFSTFLKSMKVKYTTSFSNKLFEEHPYKYTLYGLSQLLNEYHIDNVGVKIKDKDVYKLDTPFIAHTGYDFVVVDKISATTKQVYYSWNQKEYTSTTDEFEKMWTGIALLAEPTNDSIEPNYKEHRKDDLFYYIRNLLLLMLLLFVLVYSGIENIGIYSIQHFLLLAINIIGIVCCYAILLKQLHILNQYVDKVCSLFHQKDCNDVLESPAAKLGGKLSWGEIGLSYFASNIILIVGFPYLLSYLAIINLFTLPYTLWSVWYQYKIAKQWCMLCLVVQILLWAIFSLNIWLGNLLLNTLTINDIMVLSITYILPVILINLFVQFYKSNSENRYVAQRLHSFKMNESVFKALLKTQDYHEITSNDSQIIFGNPEASIRLTILTNPHCEPCALMHKRIDSLLEKASDKLSVQYVFSSFNDKLYLSNLFLIAVYLEKDKDECLKIYKEWFAGKKYDAASYYDEIGVKLDSIRVKEEAAKHDLWKLNNNLSATPIVLINGYKKTEAYKIEDILYFTGINMNDN